MKYESIANVEDGEPASPTTRTVEDAPSRSRFSMIAVGLLVVGGMAYVGKSSPSESKPDLAEVTKSATPRANARAEIAKEKVTYGDMADEDVEALFEDFIAKFKKPYATHKDTKAIRFAQFKSNLRDIDQFNARNPYAVFTVTERADWTADERSRARGLKSATLAKKPGETRSSYQILKDEFPDQKVVKMAEKGPAFVEAEAAKHQALVDAVMADTSYEVDGAEMSEAMFPMATASDCAACKMFPHFADYNMGNLPENFDWRDLGAVSAVTNQKYCGSCWSFSTAQDIEGTHFLATGDLTPLSEQQLVACDPGNDGCDGGWPFRAMQYIHKIGGMVSAEDYPYKGICAWDACDENPDGADDPTPTCDKDILETATEDKDVSAIGGYQVVAMGAEYEGLARAVLVKNGPLSIAFNANGMDYYSHGILGCDVDSEEGEVNAGCIQYGAGDGEWTCDPTAIDHAVLLVGYGVQNDVPYWVIKNSWSSEWGEDGYYRLVRGINECGVANMIVHSVVKGAAAEGLLDADTTTESVADTKATRGHSKSSPK